jgi:hypothetical protein
VVQGISSPPDSLRTGRPPSGWLDLGWMLLWMLGLAGILIFARWETIPFQLIWVGLALLYGFRIRRRSQSARPECANEESTQLNRLRNIRLRNIRVQSTLGEGSRFELLLPDNGG